MCVWNEYTECSSICKFPYITRPHGHLTWPYYSQSNSIWYSTKHISYRFTVIYMSHWHPGQQISFTYQSIMSTFTRMSHIAHVTPMFIRTLKPLNTTHTYIIKLMRLIRRPHWANTSCRCHIASSTYLISTQVIPSILHNVHFTS